MLWQSSSKYLSSHMLIQQKWLSLSKVWTFFVPSAELFSVYLPQTFSLALQYLEKGENRSKVLESQILESHFQMQLKKSTQTVNLLTFFLGVFVLPGVKIQELLSVFLLHLFLQGPLVDGLTVGSGLDLRPPCDFYPALLIFMLLLSLFSLLCRFLKEETIKAVRHTPKRTERRWTLSTGVSPPPSACQILAWKRRLFPGDFLMG